MDALAPTPKTADLINVRIPGPDDTLIGGYLARPPGPGPHPAVLMVHEWWGLTSMERVDRDMHVGFAYLEGLPEVKSSAIGLMGFCYGGGVALRHGVQNPAVATTINLSGTLVTKADGLGALGP